MYRPILKFQNSVDVHVEFPWHNGVSMASSTKRNVREVKKDISQRNKQDAKRYWQTMLPSPCCSKYWVSTKHSALCQGKNGLSRLENLLPQIYWISNKTFGCFFDNYRQICNRMLTPHPSVPPPHLNDNTQLIIMEHFIICVDLWHKSTKKKKVNFSGRL